MQKNNFTPAPGDHPAADGVERFTLRILAGRTAAEVVLLEGEKIVAQRELTPDRTLATQILSAIEEMCAAEKITLNDIGHIDLRRDPADDSSASRTAKVVADMLAEALDTLSV